MVGSMTIYTTKNTHKLFILQKEKIIHKLFILSIYSNHLLKIKELNTYLTKFVDLKLVCSSCKNIQIYVIRIKITLMMRARKKKLDVEGR